MRISNIPIIYSNDARMMNHDFKNRASYLDTYNAFGRMSKLAFDPGRLSEHPGRDCDRSQLLKVPLAMVSNSSFLSLFSSFVLSMLAASNPYFVPCGLLMYYGMH